jgi:DNA-binding response OmpR family regulator
MRSILVVDDDQAINKMVREYLLGKGYRTDGAYSGTEAVMLLERNKYQLVVLDLMLPGMTGEEVLEYIVKQCPTPVIALSAKDDVASKLVLLKGGAEDYVTKPFDPEELLARIEIVLRRNNSAPVARVLTYGNLELDSDAKTLTQLGQPVALTKNEFAILEILMERPSVVFTKDMIYEKLWNEQPDASDNTISVHVSNIRKKLAALEPDRSYVKTVWGIGFKMDSL